MLAQGDGDVIVVDWASSIDDTGSISRRRRRGSLVGLGTPGCGLARDWARSGSGLTQASQSSMARAVLMGIISREDQLADRADLFGENEGTKQTRSAATR